MNEHKHDSKRTTQFVGAEMIAKMLSRQTRSEF